VQTATFIETVEAAPDEAAMKVIVAEAHRIYNAALAESRAPKSPERAPDGEGETGKPKPKLDDTRDIILA